MKYKNKSPPPNTKFVKYKNNYDELNKESYMKLTNTLLSTGALVALGLGMTLTTTTVHADSVTSTAHESIYHLTTKDGWSNDLQTIAWNSKGNYYDLYFLHSKTSDDPNKVDERDPSVVYWHGKMLMYVAEGNEIGVYQSHDGIHCSKADPHGASKVGMGTYLRGINTQDSTPVECPALRTMKMPNGKTKQVLFFGAKAPHAGQTTGTYYIVGHLDQNGLFAPETDAKRLDQGSDYYGANFSGSSNLAEASRAIKSMGWVGNWSYTANGIHNDESANSAFTKHLGSYSVARNLELGNDMSIKSTPIVGQGKEVKHYNSVSKDHPINGINASSNRPFTNGRDTNGTIYNLLDVPSLSVNKLYNLHFYNTKSSYRGRIYIDIWQGNDYVRLNYDPSNGLYNVKTRSGELDRGRNGQAASSYYYDGLLGNGNGYIADSGVKNQHSVDLKVLTDKNSVEFFFPNGQSYTVARFNTSQKQDFKIFTEDPTNGNKVDVTQANLSQN